ncbi:MAG TPA: hypothetical protein VJZ27_07795, partial [Aggregatilineales bacterium]|nr:hypothetical protein [Aggregatilineales bacterium]
TKIVFLRTGTGGASIMQMRADGTGQTQIFDGEGRESGAVYSPDGAFIIFSVPDENGDRMLFRITADGLEPEQLTGRDAYNPVPVP